MIAAPKIKRVEELISDFSKDELIWLNGYIAGVVSDSKPFLNNGNAQPVTAVQKITISYGTETGNCKKLANEFATKAKKAGIVVKLASLDQYKFQDLHKEDYFFIIISTHGEGEPPEMSKKFYDYIHKEDLDLSHLKYSILALGDSAYPLFCKAGIDIDERLHHLGANRIIPVQTCDLDYEIPAEEWFSKLQELIKEVKPTTSVYSLKGGSTKAGARQFYKGIIVTNQNLNDKGSEKETYHIEITAGTPVVYEPGDSMAIIPGNNKDVVQTIISLGGVDGKQQVETSKAVGTINDLLTHHLNVCYLLTSTIKKYAQITNQQIPDTRMDLKDLLRIYPLKNSGQFLEVLKILNPIAPRLYSISSSPVSHEGEVHITVGKNLFDVDEEQRFGLCSTFLGELPINSEISFYIHKNRAFKLPPEDRDIIMVGPGTGIAACRSFLTHRDAVCAAGKNWLFFGEQHFQTDFLYQTELQTYLQTGVLTKISLAFSRDQEKKIYVQQRMMEEKEHLVKWINGGAYVYITGNKIMGSDVEQQIIKILGESNFRRLKEEGRYQKDIY